MKTRAMIQRVRAGLDRLEHLLAVRDAGGSWREAMRVSARPISGSSVSSDVTRRMTATLAGQVATFTPKAGTEGHPNHLTITAATVTFAGNASQIINTLDEYDVMLDRHTRT